MLDDMLCCFVTQAPSARGGGGDLPVLLYVVLQYAQSLYLCLDLYRLRQVPVYRLS